MSLDLDVKSFGHVGKIKLVTFMRTNPELCFLENSSYSIILFCCKCPLLHSESLQCSDTVHDLGMNLYKRLCLNA
jgi:hypothetical protein